MEDLQLDTAKAEILAAAGGVGEVRTARVDVTDESSVEGFFAAIPAGSVHHLVATVGASASASDITGREGFAKLRAQFDLKFFAQAVTVSYGAGKLADGGSIVLVSGALTKRPGKGSAALGAANAALEVLGRGLANDLGPRLRVNTVSPVSVGAASLPVALSLHDTTATVTAMQCFMIDVGFVPPFNRLHCAPSCLSCPHSSPFCRAWWTLRSGLACPPRSRRAC